MKNAWTFTVSGVSACQVYPYSLLSWTEEMVPYLKRCSFGSCIEAEEAAKAFDEKFPGLFVEVHDHPCDDSNRPYWRFGFDYCQCCHGCNLDRLKVESRRDYKEQSGN